MEKAILVSLASSREEKAEAEDSLRELSGLATAAGALSVRKVRQFRPRPHAGFLLGKGKIEEIAALVEELGADCVIFDRNLTPAQQRALEDALRVQVIDRTLLILDIFARRAKSREGKLQVELARLIYLLPRLSGKGIALSQLGAGIGTRGPGEKKIEEDRRRISDKIAQIRKDIRRIQQRRENQRRSRRRGPVPTAALVGYTSAGKSTLFNALSRDNRFTSPMLFATLDPVLRRVSFPDGAYFFLSDTVGFIRKLPVELITSFKATLDDVREAQVLVHVIDASTADAQGRIEAVESVLADIGADGIPTVKVYNKIDRLPEDEKTRLLAGNAGARDRSVAVSALTGEGLPALLDSLRNVLFSNFRIYALRIPREETQTRRSLVGRALVLKHRESNGYADYQVMADPDVIVNYLPYLERGEAPW